MPFRCLGVALLLASTPAASADPPTPIVFDTDMDTDCDDAGALAMLHALADLGEVEILATPVSSRYRWSAPCVAAINGHYGRGGLPVGVPKGEGAGVKRGSRYARRIAAEYPTTPKTNDDAPDAVAVYRRALAGQADAGVVVLTVGYLTNLRDLLASGPDGISALSGPDLVARKVRLWVCMGGRYPSHLDPHVFGNFKPDPAAALAVVRDWPTPVVFSGLGTGDDLLTGQTLSRTPPDNPVRRAYELFLQGKVGRASPDPVATLYAARPDALYWRLHSGGHNHLFANGTNEWRDAPDDPRHRLLLFRDGVKEAVADEMNRLMTRPPARRN